MNKGVREQVFCITSMATRLSVVISKYENYEICGFINSPFFQYSVPFRNTLGLLPVSYTHLASDRKSMAQTAIVVQFET